jgi:hypothetical protein
MDKGFFASNAIFITNRLPACPVGREVGCPMSDVLDILVSWRE